MNRYTMMNMLAFTILASWLGSGCADPGTDNNDVVQQGIGDHG